MFFIVIYMFLKFEPESGKKLTKFNFLISYPKMLTASIEF